MKSKLTHWQRLGWLGSLAGFLVVFPVVAQNANFGSMTLGAGGGSASTDGFTAGFFPLHNIASRDRKGLVCTGYAAEAPDHLLELQQDFSTLTIQVNSEGHDTTLLVQGPDGSIRCGQDTDRRNLDAFIQDEGWSAGTYRIWVGTHQQGQQRNYTISISQ